MADPQKLPSGAWRVQWLDAAGRRRSATRRSYDAARAELRNREVEADRIRSGLARPTSDRNLNELAAGWLEARKPAPNSAPDVMRRRGQRHRDNSIHLHTHILPELGELRPHEVTPEVVQRFLRKLESKPTARQGEKNDRKADDGSVLPKRTLAAGTIATVVITLRKMLVDLGHPIRISYKVPETHYGWIKSIGEVARFLDVIETPWFRVACELALYAGLRQGEVAGLRWSAVDFDRGTLQIDRSYDGPTKSKHARSIPLAPELAARLKRWRLETGAASAGFVVAVNGQMMKARADLGKRARRACKVASIEQVTFHQLRHTYASHLAQRVSLPIVGAVLGHADPKTTARYAHVDTGALARDPRLHLTFAGPSGTVLPAHAMHTAPGGEADTVRK